MTGLDIAVLLLVGLGAITGFTRGFVQEALTLAAWVIAIFAIHHLHTPVTEKLQGYVGTQSGAAVAAFVLLLLVPYTLVKMLSGRLGEASRNSVLGPVDRVIGMGFGAVKGVIMAVLGFSVLVLGYDTLWGAGGRPGWISQARSYAFIDAGSRELVRMIAERRAEAAQAEAVSPNHKDG